MGQPIQQQEVEDIASPRRRLPRWLMFGLGWLFFGLGALGVALPVLPTTPFMLLALWAFAQSSQRFHDWLLAHRVFGPPLRSWQRQRVLPLKIKLVAYSSMAISLAYVAGVVRPPWYSVAGMAAVMLYGTWFIARIPSRAIEPGTVGADAELATAGASDRRDDGGGASASG